MIQNVIQKYIYIYHIYIQLIFHCYQVIMLFVFIFQGIWTRITSCLIGDLWYMAA